MTRFRGKTGSSFNLRIRRLRSMDPPVRLPLQLIRVSTRGEEDWESFLLAVNRRSGGKGETL